MQDATFLKARLSLVVVSTPLTDEGNKAWLKTKRTMTEAERDKALQGFVDGLTKGLPRTSQKPCQRLRSLLMTSCLASS
jgi:hypothetical protein